MGQVTDTTFDPSGTACSRQISLLKTKFDDKLNSTQHGRTLQFLQNLVSGFLIEFIKPGINLSVISKETCALHRTNQLPNYYSSKI